MKIALIQQHAAPDKSDNIRRGLAAVDRAAAQGADLVVFDPQTVASRATFEKPNQYSAGIPYVAVNGVLVVDGGNVTGAKPGRPVRGPGYSEATRAAR